MATSLSVYRGQSTTGIGEGPGLPVSHGEQYLDADAPLRNVEILSAIRPWMTLDATSSDQYALGEKIEGWSYFAHENLRFVVRLGHAPQYAAFDRRVAYFAHGRAWNAGDFGGSGDGEGFDPGAHLGRSEVFEQPWSPGTGGERVPETRTRVVRFDQVAAESQVAERLLAHFYQALTGGYPIIVAVPFTEFVAKGPLHALISFARAALPLQLKLDCRIRVYTTTPHLFLKQLNAQLVAVPEAIAADALRARRDATLLDRAGVRREGRDATPQALAYAAMAMQRARKLEQALLPFAGRVGHVLPRITTALPTERDVAVARAVFNVVGALGAGTDSEREKELGDLLAGYLVKAAPEIGTEFHKIFRGSELKAVPEPKLLDVLLGSPELGQSEGGRALLDLLDIAARCKNRGLDTEVERAWPASLDDWHLQRLSLLMRTVRRSETPRVAGEPVFREAPLVTRARAVAWTRMVPLARIDKSMDVASVLREELLAGVLHERGREQKDAARLSASSRVLAVLADAVDKGMLGVEWAMIRAREAGEQELPPIAGCVLGGSLQSERWAPAVDDVLDRLKTSSTVPFELGEVLAACARRARSPASFARYLDLIDLVARANATALPALLEDLRSLLPEIERAADRGQFVRRALAGAPWSGLLVGRDRELTLPEAWLSDVASMLLSDPRVTGALSIATLLRVAARLDPADEASRANIAAACDRAMRDRPTETTAALIHADQWLSWRRGTSFQAPALRDAAMAWLTSEAWQEGRPPGATIESWAQVLKDVGKLSRSDLLVLTSGAPRARRWPWIAPFRDEQVDGLACAAADVGVLVELERAIDPVRDLGYEPKQPLLRRMLKALDVRDVPWEAVEWLALASALPGGGGRGAPKPPAVGTEAIRMLFYRAGHLSSVLLQLANHPPADFIRGIEGWGQLPHAMLHGERGFANLADKWLARLPEAGAVRPNPELAAELDRWGLPSLAAFFGGRRNLYPRAIAALGRMGGYNDPCWQELALAVPEPPASSHPISKLEWHLKERFVRLGQDEQHAILRHGFENFGHAGQRWPALFRPRLSETAPLALPAMELAFVLLPKSSAGEAALHLVNCAGHTAVVEDPAWWKALFETVKQGRPHDADHWATRTVDRIRRYATLRSTQARESLEEAADEWLMREDPPKPANRLWTR